MSPWKDFEPKSGGRRGAAVPFISIRKDGLAFSAAFVKEAEMEKYRYLTISTNADTHELAVKLHNEPTRTSLRHGPDGGSWTPKATGGRAVVTTTLIDENEWVKRVADLKDSRARRFPPRTEGDRWVIKIEPEPAFENTATKPDDIAPGLCGVYRCYRGETIVRIGEGVLRDRFNNHRARFELDRMEYSVVEDDAERVKWQNILLDSHRAKYGDYPEQNPIRA